MTFGQLAKYLDPMTKVKLFRNSTGKIMPSGFIKDLPNQNNYGSLEVIKFEIDWENREVNVYVGD